MDTNRKFHISLNVADLTRSIHFYRVLLGVEPAKCRAEYAKFELADPPVVLSLEPQRHAPGGSLNHLGLRVADAAALVDVQRRLESAGMPTQREENVECCYARQTKFWCVDPDRNNWEIYLLDEDLDHKGNAARPENAVDASPSTASDISASSKNEPVTWEYRLGETASVRIPLDDGSADEVLLRGACNADLSESDMARLFAEAKRVLRPGGRLTVHGLVADRPLHSQPSLPGPASAVQRVPVLAEPLEWVEDAGFVAIHLEKLGTSCCFQHEGIGMRELMLSATKSFATSHFDLLQTVVYRGPLREVSDDAGNVYHRGKPVAVRRSAAELLRQGPLAEQFTFLLTADLPTAAAVSGSAS